jgi:hypothetical protein
LFCTAEAFAPEKQSQLKRYIEAQQATISVAFHAENVVSAVVEAG